MSAININKNNFQNEVMDSEKPVLLDFWAPWCAPCRMVVPIIEEIVNITVQMYLCSEGTDTGSLALWVLPQLSVFATFRISQFCL